jgi:hypothetical protein
MRTNLPERLRLNLMAASVFTLDRVEVMPRETSLAVLQESVFFYFRGQAEIPSGLKPLTLWWPCTSSFIWQGVQINMVLPFIAIISWREQ